MSINDSLLAEITRAALRFHRAAKAQHEHIRDIAWQELEDEDFYREDRKAHDLADETASARTELFGVCGRHDAEIQP